MGALGRGDWLTMKDDQCTAVKTSCINTGCFFSMALPLNIARGRGTTDPGCLVFYLNYLFDHIEFVSILDNSSFRLNCLGPLCHQLWPIT